MGYSCFIVRPEGHAVEVSGTQLLHGHFPITKIVVGFTQTFKPHGLLHGIVLGDIARQPDGSGQVGGLVRLSALARNKAMLRLTIFPSASSLRLLHTGSAFSSSVRMRVAMGCSLMGLRCIRPLYYNLATCSIFF